MTFFFVIFFPLANQETWSVDESSSTLFPPRKPGSLDRTSGEIQSPFGRNNPAQRSAVAEEVVFYKDALVT